MLNNQLSSSQINETLLNAMKMIAQKEVQNLEFDVTEKYTILEKTKDKNGETCYIINVNGIKREVYAMNNEEYYPDDIVLIQIPKNNVLEKKYILGLANSTKERCFLPNSNFIPIVKKDNLKDEISLSDGMFNNSFYTFSGVILAEQFLHCNSIYVKCDFKINYPKIDYNYGIQIDTIYVNGRKTSYYFTDNSFIGHNPNIPYYFTQDILFDDISDFEDIRHIDVKFYTSANLSISSQVMSQISLRNLEVAIGKSVSNDKSGLEIITQSSSLDYNEIQNDFSRNLGLIWYNRNLDGDFVGFSSQSILNKNNEYEDILIEVENEDYSSIMTDEYDYVKKKKAFDDYYALYQTGVCPLDIVGMELIQKVNNANDFISKITNCFETGSAFINNCVSTSLEFWKTTEKLLHPKNITDDLVTYNFLWDEFDFLLNFWDIFKTHLIDFSDMQRQWSLDINEIYNIWNVFIGTIFVNVRNMQDLTINLSNIYLELPKDKNDDIIELKNIILKAEILTSMPVELQNIFSEFKSVFMDQIQRCFELCEIVCSQTWSETKLNNWKSKVTNLQEQYENLFDSLFEDIVNTYNLTEKNISISENELMGIYENKDFIDISYPTSGEDLPYYNIYLLKYQNYLKDTEDNKNFDKNFSIIDEEKKFNLTFELDETTKNKFALYWYEEDLNNSEIDPLLNEDCWTKLENEEYLTFPSLNLDYGENKYYLNKSTPYERMLSITLPPHLKSKTYKVVLYYNHKLQGSAEITFNNKSYIDIGFENSQIDLEYGKGDFRTLSLNKFGKPNRLSVSVFCYNEKDGREVLTNVKKSEISETPITFPTLQMLPMLSVPEEFSCIEHITNKDILKAKKIGKKGEINFVFRHKQENRMVPFGVYQFKLWLDEKTTTSTYLPMAWSLDNYELSLSGAKMISIKDDNSFVYDAWINNESTPQPFSLTGAKNIQNLDFFIEYYQGGYQVDAAVQNGEPFTIIKNNNQYQLSFDITQSRQCLKKGYRPVLKITGTYDDDNKPFTFYQSLFILHSKYDYENNVFIDETQIEPQDEFIFIDPKEKIFANDIKSAWEQERYTFIDPNYGVIKIKQNQYQKALDELNRILNDESVSGGYEYYFSNLANYVPKDKSIFIKILTDLQNNTINWDSKLTFEAKEYNSTSTHKKKQELPVSNWIGLLFEDFINYASQYEYDRELYYSKLYLSYDDIKAFLSNQNIGTESDK